MFFDLDSILNNIIFLIPVAIVVTRLIGRARAKKAPPPKKPPQPYIPVHFEDDEEDDLGYFRNRAATADAPQQRAKASPRKAQKTVAAPFTPKPEFAKGAQPLPAVAKIPGTTAPPARKDFVLSLNHLSPLKQAVVMAEVLSQPKGML